MYRVTYNQMFKKWSEA
ncbi:TPA: hypothetical protein RFE25_001737 [Staphylococcus aureus]|nr:hypothetical protein [Staphylococcus aureus]HDH6296392.1 hypothetical protein [Staphylococcus aureus LTCF-1-17]MBO8540459.1 hypothetical protein [Staphylococcus aureus]MBW0196421.1 hypothetical protein [Staphylococcus aureus]MBW0210030.1 hypothetical protein [Staphylococcus aureus]